MKYPFFVIVLALIGIVLVAMSEPASAHIEKIYTRCYFQTGVYHCH